MEEKVLAFINYLRSKIKDRPQCMMLALLLKCKFESAELLYNTGHFITLIDGQCYDWDGVAERTDKFTQFPEGWGDIHIVNHYNAIRERFINNSTT